MALQLVIGDKNYSSWSLRAALAVDLAGADCEELRVRLFQPDSRAQLLRYSPTGKVPVLLTEQGAVWDSLAIAEYLAECYPEAQLWPQERQARALARSICAEMHSGFTALRSHLPMDLARDKALAELPDEAQADIDRICAIWAGCRERYARPASPMPSTHRSPRDCAVIMWRCRQRLRPMLKPSIAGRRSSAGIRQHCRR